MKKVLKRLLVLTLVSMFALGSTGVFAAENANVQATLEKGENIKVSKQTAAKPIEKSSNLKAIVKKSALSNINSLSATTMTYSTTAKPAYAKGVIPGVYSTNTQVLCLPIKANATGKLWIDAVVPIGSPCSVQVYVGTLSGSTFTPVNDYGYVTAGKTDIGIGGLDVVAGRTYYIGLANSKENALVNLRGYVYTYTSGRTLPVNKIMLSSGVKGSSNATPSLLYKIKPSKTGTISVSLTEYGMSSSAGYVTLYNSKKKAISSKLWYYSKSSSSRAYFGVKAGTTYYIKITDARGSYSSQYKYGVKYTNTKVTDRNLSKKSKAKTIKRKKSVSTVFVALTGKSVDWYKFKVTKKRKTQIKLYTSGIKSGNLYVTVYKGKKKIGSTKKVPYYANSFTGTITYGRSYGKADKGTYYVKVQQGAKCSGKYSIKYVK